MLAVLALLAAPAAAEARDFALRDAGIVLSPVVSDGRWRAAYEPRPGVVRLVPPRGRSFELGVPAPCVGGLTAVGSGLLLFACPGDKLGEYQPVPFRVIDERTGRTLLTDGLNPFPSDVWGTSPLPEAIGHFWAAGDWPSARESHVWATPWRTGRGRYADTRRGVVLDLDLPSGRRRLCRPLLRGLGEERWLSDVRRILPAVVDGPWLLQGGFGVGRLTGPLVLKRCGARHERRLGDGGDAQLGAGLVSWRTDRRVVVLHLRDGARSTATLPPTGDAGWRLARVGRRVFATAPIGVSWDPSGYRLLSGRIAGP